VPFDRSSCAAALSGRCGRCCNNTQGRSTRTRTGTRLVFFGQLRKLFHKGLEKLVDSSQIRVFVVFLFLIPFLLAAPSNCLHARARTYTRVTRVHSGVYEYEGPALARSPPRVCCAKRVQAARAGTQRAHTAMCLLHLIITGVKASACQYARPKRNTPRLGHVRGSCAA